MTKILSIFILMLFPVLVLSQEVKLFDLFEDELGVGPETRYKAFVGFCPEAYFLEFDHFYPHDDNTLFLQHLNN